MKRRQRAAATAAAMTAAAALGLSSALPAQASTSDYSISGHVSIPEDAPEEWLAGVSVFAEGIDVSAWTWADVDPETGWYTITIDTPGDYRVTFYAGGYVVDDVWLQTGLVSEHWDDALVEADARPVHVDGVETGIDAALSYGRTLAGTVAIADLDVAAEGWDVIAEAFDPVSGERLSGALADETGAYEIAQLPAMPVMVTFTAYPWSDSLNHVTTEHWDDELKAHRADVVDLTGDDATGIDVELGSRRSLAGYDTECLYGDPDLRFCDEILWLVDSGISTGWVYDEGPAEFRPNNSVTRDAMAAFLYRYAGSPAYEAPEVSPFADVTPASSAFYTEICWLAEQGITTGWDAGDGTREFRPYARITRDAMAAFLYRFAGSPAYEPPSEPAFVDVDVDQPFATEISWLADAGISTGWTVAAGKEFRPFTRIKRDAMAAFLYRLDDLG